MASSEIQIVGEQSVAAGASRPSFSPSVDVSETPSAITFQVDTPGLTKKDIHVRVSGRVLEISGERKWHESAGDASHRVWERGFGAFSRRFQLPESADMAGTSAVCDHGVITVTVPKTEEARRAPDDGTAVEIYHEGDGSLNDQFAAIPLSVFPTPSIGKLIIIRSDSSILDAVRVLSSNHILAAPVRDTKQPDDASWADKYLGVVDMVGLVFFMLDKLRPDSPDSFFAEAQKREEFRSTSVAEAVSFARFGPFIPVDEDRDNLLDCMLLCGKHHVRRVPVVKCPGGDIVNIVTQSALIQTLSANLDKLSSVGSKTLAELGLNKGGKVWSVKDTEPLMNAFMLMKNYNISAVPVLFSDTGKIRGNVSARDVRLLVSSDKIYKLLNMPVSLFLEVVTETAGNSAVTCIETDTVEDVIRTLVRARIHRLYLVDSNGNPLRVISLADILQLFVKEPEGYFGHYFM